MKPKTIVYCLLLSMFITGCSGQILPTHTPVLPTITSIPSTFTPEPTKTIVPPTITPVPDTKSNLPIDVEVNGDRVTFKEWGLSIDLPSDVWEFNPSLYNKTSNFEGYAFSRIKNLVAKSGDGYSPTIGITFYSVPEDTQLINFSSILRAQIGKNSPSIDTMFGHEGSEPKLKIPALVYYGHLREDDKYSVYIVHTVKGTVGVQVSFEIVDSVLDQARNEFFQIISSIDFDKNILSPGLLPVNSLAQETSQSSKSASFISQALIAGGLNLSQGSDGKGKGTDSMGRIITCADLSSNLTTYQQFGEIVVNDLNDFDTSKIHVGDVVIFTDALIPKISAHAAIITKIENNNIYITSQYGPKSDGTYYVSGYSDLPVSEFLTKVFKEIHIFYNQN